jgi:flagellar FliJ protein
MKKFKYRLETVLEYKTRILDTKKNEYAECMQRVVRKQQEIDEIRAKSYALLKEFDEIKHSGAPIEHFLLYSRMIDQLEAEADQQEKVLLQLVQKSEDKKQEVISISKDVSGFEKLKERRKTEYHLQEQKDQENFIEEFVSYRSHVSEAAS